MSERTSNSSGGDTRETEPPSEGNSPRVLRALNFSGGGFDTVMQLGVTHALLVNRGRAPDFVVGISAGTIQAVALAEVLRADGCPIPPGQGASDEDLAAFRQAYEETLDRRVAKFRKFANATHRAPEELVDSFLPDAYQIDSFDPLAPLELPTFFQEEREDRIGWIRCRSGLVRLYNDLLALNLPVGTIARLVRRFLGIKAASSIGKGDVWGALARGVVRVTEFMKAWVVIGDSLGRLIHVVRLVVRPVVNPYFRVFRIFSMLTSGADRGVAPKTDPKSAGSIIYRFGVTGKITKARSWLISFLFLANVWTGLTVFVLVLPLLLAAPVLVCPSDSAVGALCTPNATYSSLRLLLLLVYVPILFPLIPRTHAIDKQRHLQAWWDFSRGAFVLFYSLTKWSLILVGIAAVFVTLFDTQAIANAIRPNVARIVDIEPISVTIALAATAAVTFLVARLMLLRVPVDRPGSRENAQLDLRAASKAVITVVCAVSASLLPFWLAFRGVLASPLVALSRQLADVGVVPEGLEQVALGRIERVPETILIAMGFAIGLALATFVFICVLFLLRDDRRTTFFQWLLRRILSFYEINRSIAHPYGLKRFLVEQFDTKYYGKPDLIEASLRAIPEETGPAVTDAEAVRAGRRRIGEFLQPAKDPKRTLPRIAVGIPTANLNTRQLEVLEPSTRIVDGLLAATAAVPLFPAKKIRDCYHIDALNVGHVPTTALMQLLRREDHPGVTALHIYAVDPLPVSEGTLSAPIEADGTPKDTPYLNLVDIGNRALQLQRFRDVHVERRLTQVFTGVFPDQSGRIRVVDEKAREKSYYRAYVAPIELEEPLSLSKKIIYSPKEGRRTAINETIALGCRASLQTMLAETLKEQKAALKPEESTPEDGKETSKEQEEARKPSEFILCRDAVDAYLEKHSAERVKLPGSQTDAPGLSEICANCFIKDENGKVLVDPATGLEVRKCLRLPPDKPPKVQVLLDWPHELESSAKLAKKSDVLTKEQDDEPPVTSTDSKDHNPARACLFGGGVFRGVFQVGVLNALELAEFRPVLLGGASVGSIMAAAVRSILTADSDRARALENFTVTNLTLDRTVLTDRFADFVRNWTIRASEVQFSIKDLDLAFRKYDARSAMRFLTTLRLVLAGLERLFYINPYDLNDLVAALRRRNYKDSAARLSESAQDWLDRMGVGREVLGAEPLYAMAKDYVVAPEYSECPEKQLLNQYEDQPRLIATTTNLTQGALHILGTCRPHHDNERNPSLIEALLASSAFPGVFRPRQSWDLKQGDSAADEYVDGGLMDNLPLEPVLRELRAMAVAREIDLRPSDDVPHLVLAASLEPSTDADTKDSNGDWFEYWPEVQSRAKELKYNRKLDMYVHATRNAQDVYLEVTRQNRSPIRDPVHTAIVPIKPKWLCSTFAFHPMLGFRRVNQAKSIAHGCASTLMSLREAPKAHRAAVNIKSDDEQQRWKMTEEVIPRGASFLEARAQLTQRREESRRRSFKAGKCWLQDEKLCPFSRQSLESSTTDGQAPELRAEVVYWVSQIHKQCWRPVVHTSDAVRKDGVIDRIKQKVSRSFTSDAASEVSDGEDEVKKK